MKSTLFFLPLLLSSITGFSQNDTIIWRSISILDDRSLTIGESIESFNDVIERDAPNLYHLKSGQFSGADSIALETDEKDRLVKITFFYDPNTVSFDNSVRTLNNSLVGARHTLKKNKKKAVATWCDQYSCFRMSFRQDKSGNTEFYSEIAAL